MPYEWVKRIDRAPEDSGALSDRGGDTPLAVLHLWPNRSLSRAGFAWIIGATGLLLLLPLIEALGTPALWGLLPFVLMALGGLWWGLRRNLRDGQLIEELRLFPDRIEVTRHNPRGPRQTWQANPYWVTLNLHQTGGPVPDYLTLKGGGREVELGAFLSPEERVTLHQELQRALAALG